LNDEDEWADYMISEMTEGEVTSASDARVGKGLAQLKCPKCGGHEWELYRQPYGLERLGVFDAETGEFNRDNDELADLLIVCRNCEFKWRSD